MKRYRMMICFRANCYVLFLEMELLTPFNRIPSLSLTSQNSDIYAREIPAHLTAPGSEQFPCFLPVDGRALC